MKRLVLFCFLLLLSTLPVWADTPTPPVFGEAPPIPPLAPNAIIELRFPELSNNLAKVMEKQEIPNVLVAQLPANYSANQKFPIALYIDGGTGGTYLRTARMREAMGTNDFIIVRLPLFKIEQTRADVIGIHAIKARDYDIISKNYRVMLQKLFDIVPNITPERSILGGFSNGAHTTGILLSKADPFILEHFTHFYMVEGGIGQLGAEGLKNPALKGKHFLAMLGDRGRANPFEGTGMGSGILAAAHAQNLDFTAMPMRGYGHEMPLDYLKLLPFWVRGEALPEVPPKLAPPANTPAAETPKPEPPAQ